MSQQSIAITWVDLEDTYHPGRFAVKDGRLYYEAEPGERWTESFGGREWVYVGCDFAARKIADLYSRLGTLKMKGRT